MAEAIQETVQETTDKPKYTPEQIRARRKRDCALGYRLFAAQRWGDLGDGHISARDPERTDCFWMLRYGVSYHAAKVSDLVLVNPDGELVEGEGFINIAGYYIHHPILEERPDLVSAVHVHTGWGTPFSAEARMIEPISQESCIFFEDHALWDDEEVQVQSVSAGGALPEFPERSVDAFAVHHSLLRSSEQWEFFVDDDVPNFTEFAPGSKISQDGDEVYTVGPEPEYIVFPNRQVPIGQRAGLMLRKLAENLSN